MTAPFVHDAPAQRVLFANGALARVPEEIDRLGANRALVIATPGSGVRLGRRVVEALGARSAGLHAEAVMHVPRAVAVSGIQAAQAARADLLISVGGGSAIGLAKAIAHTLALPIVAVPTTYSGSEATPIFGLSEGERKEVGRDPKVLPRTIIYDTSLTVGLSAATTAASGLNAVAHCVEALWVAERTPLTSAYAAEALRLFARQLPRAVADGGDLEARGDCLIAAWLAGASLASGTGLHHKLAHVLGGFGLPHAETHAIILPHVTRFNLAGNEEDLPERLAAAFGGRDPVATLEAMVQQFPIPKRLRDVGFAEGKIDAAAAQIAALQISTPRPVSAGDVQTVLQAAL